MSGQQRVLMRLLRWRVRALLLPLFLLIPLYGRPGRVSHAFSQSSPFRCLYWYVAPGLQPSAVIHLNNACGAGAKVIIKSHQPLREPSISFVPGSAKLLRRRSCNRMSLRILPRGDCRACRNFLIIGAMKSVTTTLFFTCCAASWFFGRHDQGVSVLQPAQELSPREVWYRAAFSAPIRGGSGRMLTRYHP